MNAESPATTLRPRNRRLISLDESDDTLAAVDILDHHSLRPEHQVLSSSSRAHSPTSSNYVTNRNLSRSHSRTEETLRASHHVESKSASSIFPNGLLEASWSSVQGIAYNLLGGDKFRERSESRSPPWKPRSLAATQSTKSSTPAQWGPSGSGGQELGYGSREDRLAQVQARKRETLLAADRYRFPDTMGRYKRRDSEEDRGASQATQAESDHRDTLVYLHKVKPSDTLAGVMIKYNCQPNAFRRANRLWPNDSIQVRKTVFLPVEACGVKGRKVFEPPSSPILPSDETLEDSMLTPTDAHCTWPNPVQRSDGQGTPFSSIHTSPSPSPLVLNSEEEVWRHDSWVMIDGIAEAVEIGRLSRRTLGFFPPSRRKSTTFSDLDTPAPSIDLPRHGRQNEQHQRKASRSSSGSHFAHQLQGPGGVGTLGRDVHNPGPAQDRLNKIFAPHLPNVAPRTSFESITSASSTGIENVGGTIEGWVRKIASKAVARVQSPAPAGGRSGIGDLIELVDSAEASGDGINDDGIIANGDLRPTTKPPRLKPQSSPTEAWREEQERSLREHFPPRGRVFGDSTRRSGRTWVD